MDSLARAGEANCSDLTTECQSRLNTRVRSPSPAHELPECEICYQHFGVERKPLPCHGCKKQFCKPCLMDWVKHQPSLSKRDSFTDYTCPNCRRRMHEDLLTALGVRPPIYRLSAAYVRGSIRDHGNPRPRPTRPAQRARLRSMHSQSMHRNVTDRPQSTYESSSPYYRYNLTQSPPYYMMPPTWPGSGGFSTAYANPMTGMPPSYAVPTPTPTVAGQPYWAAPMIPTVTYHNEAPEYHHTPQYSSMLRPSEPLNPALSRPRYPDIPHSDLSSEPVRSCPALSRRNYPGAEVSELRQLPRLDNWHPRPFSTTYMEPPRLQSFPSHVPTNWSTMTLPPPVGMFQSSVQPPVVSETRHYSSIYSQSPAPQPPDDGFNNALTSESDRTRTPAMNPIFYHTPSTDPGFMQ